MPMAVNLFFFTWNQETMQVADKGVVALFTELSTKVVQVERPDKGSSKAVISYVTDLHEEDNTSTAEVMLTKYVFYNMCVHLVICKVIKDQEFEIK